MLYPEKKHITLSAGIFFLFAVFGFVFNSLKPDSSYYFFSEVEKHFQFILEFNFLTTFLFILINNSVKILIGMILGILFGIIPFLFLALNGFVLGLVAGYVFPSFGINLLLLSLLPHGVFEFSALFIGSAYAFYLAEISWNLFKQKKIKIKELKDFGFILKKFKIPYNNVLSGFLYIVLPLLIIAALVETFLIFYL